MLRCAQHDGSVWDLWVKQMILKDTEYVLNKLRWMEDREIWPNGSRYLWTDAFGVVLLTSLYETLHEDHYLARAEWVIEEVYRVLGRQKGIRIGEEPDRDGQYFHYLAMWLYALHCIGRYRPEHAERARTLAQEIFPHFVRPGVGVIWKMQEDLSEPYPGYGLGALDPFHGYVVYRLIDEDALRDEVETFRELVADNAPRLEIDQDLGLGMMLWFTHFFPDERWASLQRERSLEALDELWVPDPGYYCRQHGARRTRFAFTNYGISLGLQAVGESPERVQQLNDYFESYRSGDEYDVNAITHVMACTSHFPGLFIHASE